MTTTTDRALAQFTRFPDLPSGELLAERARTADRPGTCLIGPAGPHPILHGDRVADLPDRSGTVHPCCIAHACGALAASRRL